MFVNQLLKKNSKLITSFALLPSLLLASISFNSHMTNEGSSYNYTTEVTAHRGNSIKAPENTEAAIVKAIQDGADYVEIDAQETLDGQVVLLHDNTFLRTGGLNKAPYELTMNEINSLDVGSWFSSSYKGEQVPRLRDILIKYKDHVKFNIHLKNGAKQKRLNALVAEIISDTNAYDQCIISSFEYSALVQMKKYSENIKVGLIVYDYNHKLLAYKVDFYSVSTDILSPSLVQTLHSNGKEIHVWSVNDKKTFNNVYSHNVHNIITNNVTLARQELTANGIRLAPRLHPDWLKNSYAQ